MQYIYKLFKWDDENNRTDLTEFLTFPLFLETRCNEELPTGQVTLERTPVNIYKERFQAKTKFTIERWVGDNLNKYYDYVVSHDDVEEYAGLPEYNCHRIHLIEPSVFAQGLHCDNFALTYELSDVTFDYKTVISTDEKAVANNTVVSGSGFQRPTWTYGTAVNVPGSAWHTRDRGNSTNLYTNSFLYRWNGIEALDNFTRNLNGLIQNTISFTMPIIQCFANGGAVADYLFDCPTRCSIIRTTLQNGIAIDGTAITVVSQLYSPANVQNRNDRLMYNSGGVAGLRGTQELKRTQNLPANSSSIFPTYIFPENEITNLPAMINTNNADNSSRAVTFLTDALTTQDFANGLSYDYRIILTIEPFQSGAFLSQYTSRASVVYTPPRTIILIIWMYDGKNDYTMTYTNYVTPNTNSINASVSFVCRNLLEDAAETPPFLLSGRPYCCFDLFRRAMLTTDTRIFDNSFMGLDELYDNDFNDIGIQYPIAISTDWMQRLKESTMFESIFEVKNLWEVMQQIGHYIHAIPYLEFARNGKDQFLLKFKQLGGTNYGNDESNKVTIFNSQTLDNFFTQYDAYVTNLFSPQNQIDEWIVVKTSDSGFLISNDTAELHTKYNVSEIVEFDITYNGETKSALEFVFEKTVYDILSARVDFVPAKWSALYYEMGTNKILGLNYVPPTKNNDGYMALKTIVGRVFSNNVTDANLQFNSLKFHIKYRTQDSLRLNQVRPDLERFMKSSKYETYPHHEQFFNQPDKIVDSERFSANLWGRLIRVANGIYQRQESAELGQEKEPGDLIDIDNQSYYITEVENECYPEITFQKVTYSKNFNQLSNIVTIPSEPRFFEISERSIIRREVRLLDFIKLSTLENIDAPPPRFIAQNKWMGFIRNLLFADSGNATLPNFAYTNFKADRWRNHYNLPNNDINTMFPSNEADTIEDGTVQPKSSTPNRQVIVPVLHFPLRNAIVFEWDMDDNFKAGDSRDTTVTGQPGDIDTAYTTLQPVRYTDVYGRADLFDFKLFYKDNWTDAQVSRLPYAGGSDFTPSVTESIILLPNTMSVSLDKDNREALSFNYQINLLHESHDNDAEDFVLFSNLFGKKNGRLKAVLLKNEVSMFDEAVRMDVTTIVADNVPYSFTDFANRIKIDFTPPAGIDLSEVKSIVLYDEENNSRYAYIAKNVARLPDTSKLQSWWIYPVFNGAGWYDDEPAIEVETTFPYTEVVFDLTSTQMQEAPPYPHYGNPVSSDSAVKIEYISIPLAGTPLDGVNIISIENITIGGFWLNDDPANRPAVDFFIENNTLYLRLALAEYTDWYRFHNLTSDPGGRVSQVTVVYTTNS